MNVFVVNLARRPDRRARMERILPPSWDVEYTTHWAGPLDGASIDPAEMRAYGLFDWQVESTNEWWNRPLKLGEIGCAVSHLLCWRLLPALYMPHPRATSAIATSPGCRPTRSSRRS
jgi:glycosyl transferase, family 25